MNLYPQCLNVVSACRCAQLITIMITTRQYNDSHNPVNSERHDQSEVSEVRTISSPGKVRKVELDLVPALIQAHWHCADERLYSGCGLQHTSLSAKLLTHLRTAFPQHFDTRACN